MTRHYHAARRLIPFLVTLTAVSWSAATVYAAKVKVWHHHQPAHFDQCKFHQAVVSNEGTLRLARDLRPLVALEAAHIWDIVEDRAGNLFVATGNEGKVFKVTPEGKVSVALDSQDSQILCLALAPDGAVFAGTGPSGLIVRIGPDGNTRIIYDSPESYIWALVVTDQGKTIYAGTGPQGRIYRLLSQGRAGVFYETKQRHILSLAQGPDGLLYAGTDKDGLVYRIDAKGKGFVLYSAPQAEVRRLLVSDDGVYAGTSAPASRSAPGTSGSVASGTSSSSSANALPTSVATATRPTADGEEESATSSKDKTEAATDKPRPAPAPARPNTGENSLYRIAPDGSVREVFREKALVLSLLRQPGRFYVGTGTDGKLYEVNERTKEASEIARLNHGQVQVLCRRRDGSIVIGASDPGKLYVLADRHTSRGSVVSEVLDAAIISQWGALTWQGHTPPGTAITIATRGGNLPEPDETWSDWSEEQTDPRQAIVAAPAARFLQYRVTLTTTNPAVTPELRDLTIRYRTTNQAPEITQIDYPNLDAVNLDNPKKLKFQWTATDANEDDLTYSVYVRKTGWQDWVLLAEDVVKKEYEWDTTTTPSGHYHVKIVASDRKDNPAEEALTGARVAGPFVVAHTPPTVTVRVQQIDGQQAIIAAEAEHALVRLTEASFAVNGQKWTPIFPTDRLFDSRRETFHFATDTLKPGTHVLVLRVRDAAGNVGLGDVVFTVPERD
ncbi:MAG: hypothetical protein ACK4RK_03015 [Gemmataceae bacterium]